MYHIIGPRCPKGGGAAPSEANPLLASVTEELLWVAGDALSWG